MDWKDSLDEDLRTHLNAQLKEVLKQKNAYSGAQNPTNAQLWVAIAGLSKQIFNLNLKLTYLERALKDIGKDKKEDFSAKLGLLELELQNLVEGFKDIKKQTKKKTSSKKGKANKKR